MRIITKFISPILEQQRVHKHFLKYLSSQIIKEKQKTFFLLLLGRPTETDWPTTAFGLGNRAGRKARRPGSRLRPKADLAQQRAEGRQPRHAGVPGTTAVRQRVDGRCRPRPGTAERARVHERKANTRRWLKRREKKRGSPFHARGQVRRHHDRRWRNRSW
jgi:hypothetical protein